MGDSLTSMIDHALLHPTMTDDEIRQGCELAKKLAVASVCVKPYAISIARNVLDGSRVRIGTVIGFPHGSNATHVKMLETKIACEEGAHEVDMVVNIGKALSGAWDYVEADIRSVVDTAHSYAAICKVIFETDYITRREDKIRLCEICSRVGADFVKTSTGFGYTKQSSGDYNYTGATLADVQLMKEHVFGNVQIKASGGIRSADDARRMVANGATRLGTSASEAIAQGETHDSSSY